MTQLAGNDICKEAKRQIISIEDVFTALEDLEFTELLPPLKESLEGMEFSNPGIPFSAYSHYSQCAVYITSQNMEKEAIFPLDLSMHCLLIPRASISIRSCLYLYTHLA